MINKTNKLTCFKAYDIRGELDKELDESIAYRIGRAFGLWLYQQNNEQSNKNKTVVVGGDIRLTSESLKQSLAEGLRDANIDVIDLGMTGTEEIYFATSYLNADGGVEVTASHNPINFNGMKLVKEHAKPISGDTGLKDIQKLAEQNEFPDIQEQGKIRSHSCIEAYIDHLLSYINVANIKPLTLVVNSGNGAAGHIIDALEKRFNQLSVPIEFIKIHHQADGTFPNGIPNPLLEECREDTKNAVIKHNADMGIAWDGDFDRCFLFDEKGNFIDGYYIIGLLAEVFLKKNPNAKIIHDPRLTWNTIDVVTKNNGIAIQSKTGHAFIKERMRKEDAIYGGEMSAHHYFKDFNYCDSGMIPWLLVIELLSIKHRSLLSLIQDRIEMFPCSGEVNFTVNNTEASIKKVKHYFLTSGDTSCSPLLIDTTDGLSIEFKDWRFNLRASNTEPLLRLNVESRNNRELMQNAFEEIKALISNFE